MYLPRGNTQSSWNSSFLVISTVILPLETLLTDILFPQHALNPISSCLCKNHI